MQKGMEAMHETRKPLRLFWCWTGNHAHDWFVVARTAEVARRFHEDAEGLTQGSTFAEAVAILPDHMQDRRFCGWPDEETILGCGGEIEHDPTTKIVKINGQRYVEGDLSHLLVTYRH
jgi:hypothetical protein